MTGKVDMTKLDVITIGRSSVDLYGSQVGGRLEDMASFDKYIGGSPTNIACGTARLGLKSALISRPVSAWPRTGGCSRFSALLMAGPGL